MIMEYLFLWFKRTGIFLRKQIGLSNKDVKVIERVYNLKAKQQNETADIRNGHSENDGPDMHLRLPSYVGTVIKWKLTCDKRPSREQYV